MRKLENSAHCFVCGLSNKAGLCLTFRCTSAGTVATDYFTYAPQFEDYPGVVHGGLIQTALLETAGRACMTEGGVPPRFVTCAEETTRYIHSVPVGATVRVCGILIKDHPRLCHASAELEDGEGSVLARLEGKFRPLPKERVLAMDLVAGGWRVYPDPAGI